MSIERAFTLRAFQQDDAEAVVALWRLCGLVRPWNDPHKDIARKLSEQPELFLVGCIGAEVVSTAMVGFDGHRGWVYYLAVAPGMQRRSLGRAMMERAEQLLIARGCPKISLMVRSENSGVLTFYRELGYAEDKVSVLGKRLIPDI
ncbi:MAG: GNAT family acetyltransferase [Pseudomonadota bacterium]